MDNRFTVEIFRRIGRMTKCSPRVSYSGYYATLPRSRYGSDSRYPLHNQSYFFTFKIFFCISSMDSCGTL